MAYMKTDAEMDIQRVIETIAPLLVLPDDVELAAMALARARSVLPTNNPDRNKFKNCICESAPGVELFALLDAPWTRAETLRDWAKVNLLSISRGCL